MSDVGLMLMAIFLAMVCRATAAGALRESDDR